MATSQRKLNQLRQGKHRSPTRNAQNAAIRAGVAKKVKGQPNTYLLTGKRGQAYADAMGGTNYTPSTGITFVYHDDHAEQ